LVDKTLRVLGVSIVSAISRRRCGAEEAEDAETDSNAERAEVTEVSGLRRQNFPRPRRFDRLRDLSSPLPRRFQMEPSAAITQGASAF
jgi:hypothetical protein